MFPCHFLSILLFPKLYHKIIEITTTLFQSLHVEKSFMFFFGHFPISGRLRDFAEKPFMLFLIANSCIVVTELYKRCKK